MNNVDSHTIMGPKGVLEFQRFNEAAGNIVDPGVGDGSSHPMRDSISPVAGSDHPTVDIEYGKMSTPARTTSTQMLAISGSKETVHRVGQDAWWEVGFHLVAAINSAFILGYPALIMAYLGWVMGPIFFIIGGVYSLYNNYLLGSLHEVDGIRHIRYRDLCGHIYGPVMYKLTWITQYFNLSIANVGTIILCGQALKAIAGITSVHLSGWIAIAGVVCLAFATIVPNLSALRYISGLSLLLSLFYTVVAIVVSIQDGLKAPPRDYSLLGNMTDKAFNAIGALATIAFAFNTGILPEMQATIRRPATTNIYKALCLQFTIGTIPFFILTFVGYWAYGNVVYPYILINLSGPKPVIIATNIAAFLQALVALHIFATPIYEFIDTFLLERFVTRRNTASEYSASNLLTRFVTRGLYLTISTFFGALLPLFGDFIALTGALAAFSLQVGIVHHMYIKVMGKNFGKIRLVWHWFNVVAAVILTFATVAASLHYIIHDSVFYHAFADI